MPSSGIHAHRPQRRTWMARLPALAVAGFIGACLVLLVGTLTARVIKTPASRHVQAPDAKVFPGEYSRHHVVVTLPAQPASYLGAYAAGVPGSYAPIQSLADSAGVHPNVALYYSGWQEPFQTAFAVQAANHDAVPFVQIDPAGVSFPAITAGVYDSYLETFATAVANFGASTGRGVIIGFGHEMNGRWFPWGYQHVTPALFVAAWRHIVDVFRQQGADDVTWLWTVNIMDPKGGIPSPAAWWPGSSYVTWVGIDGYYYKPSWMFASLFGPTIKAIRALTVDPVLIAETGAAPVAGQPAKIANMFSGVHVYGLLGVVWFDANHTLDWRIRTPAAFAALSQGASTFATPAS